jgi:hypothetical protein
MPKVSVCVPTYNTARYLPETIESVLRQEFADYELVICDNASTDNTTELCRGYNDPRIRYLRFDENTNQAGNFNRCLREARGEFLTILHSDDFFLPGFLTDRVNRLTTNPEIDFVFGAVRIVDAASEFQTISRQWTEDRFFKPGEFARLPSVRLHSVPAFADGSQNGGGEGRAVSHGFNLGARLGVGSQTGGTERLLLCEPAIGRLPGSRRQRHCRSPQRGEKRLPGADDLTGDAEAVDAGRPAFPKTAATCFPSAKPAAHVLRRTVAAWRTTVGDSKQFVVCGAG